MKVIKKLQNKPRRLPKLLARLPKLILTLGSVFKTMKDPTSGLRILVWEVPSIFLTQTPIPPPDRFSGRTITLITGKPLPTKLLPEDLYNLDKINLGESLL